MISNDPPLSYHIENVKWHQDDWGDYWVAELFCNGKRVGLTGTYYSLNAESTARPPRAEQEQALSAQFGDCAPSPEGTAA